MRCPIHDCEMRTGSARMSVEDGDAEYREARARLFPHANSSLGLACMMPDSPADSLSVDFCPRCREAERAWRRRRR